MTDIVSPRCVETVIMRGGSSRGPVLLAKDFPDDQQERDRWAVALVGDGAGLIDGVGGGSPITAKIVLVEVAPEEDSEADLNYVVGNIVIGKNSVDWSGTCGNMTSTVPLFALEQELLPDAAGRTLRLRNLSTDGIIETSFRSDDPHQRGSEIQVRTSYLDPIGSVFGHALPTGSPMDQIEAGGRSFEASIVDVAHPYIFLSYEQVVGGHSPSDPQIVELIEDIRGAACVRLGIVAAAEQASTLSPAVPRLVLIHDEEVDAGGIRITAVSMGQIIGSVPVTAALCLIGARSIPGTLVAARSSSAAPSTDLRVVARDTSITAGIELTPDGRIRSVGLDRTSRTIMQGQAWIS